MQYSLVYLYVRYHQTVRLSTVNEEFARIHSGYWSSKRRNSHTRNGYYAHLQENFHIRVAATSVIVT